MRFSSCFRSLDTEPPPGQRCWGRNQKGKEFASISNVDIHSSQARTTSAALLRARVRRARATAVTTSATLTAPGLSCAATTTANSSASTTTRRTTVASKVGPEICTYNCILSLFSFTDPRFRTEPPPGQRCAGSEYNGGNGGSRPGKRCCTPTVGVTGDNVWTDNVCVVRTLVTRERATVTASRTAAAETEITAAR